MSEIVTDTTGVNSNQLGFERDQTATTARKPNFGQPTELLNNEEAEQPTESNVAEDESRYPTGTQVYLILLTLALVLVVIGMDSSVIAVAVPRITDHFHTVADVGWYSSAYRLCACSFQFMFGKLYKMFSVKKTFLVSILIFMVGSGFCAAAPSSTSFIFGRAVCGFAASGVQAGCFAVLLLLLPLRKRPLYTSILAAIEGASYIGSPILGGAVVEKLGWRWCFWISLPLSGLTLGALFFFLSLKSPAQRTSGAKQIISELDILGNVLFVPSLSCLFIALSWAGTRYSWKSPTVIGLFCTFAALLGIFAYEQHRKGNTATLPPRVLRNRSVMAGFIFSFGCNSATNLIEYYLPTYFQTVRDYSPAESGYMMLPMVAGTLIAMLAQGLAVSMAGYYAPFMLAGSLLMPLFAGLLTTLAVDTQLAKILCYSGFFGVACGIGFQAPQVAVQNSLSSDDMSIGISIILFAQNFGPAISISIAQSIFTNRLSKNLQQLAPGLNATSIEAMGLSDLKHHVKPKVLQGILLGFDKSLVQTWYLAVALGAITIIGSASMEWKSVKQKKN